MSSRQRIVAVVVGAGLLLVGTAGWMLRAHLLPEAPTESAGESQAPSAVSSADSGGVVVLDRSRLEAAGIRTEHIAQRTLRHRHVVPGRLQYDDTRHVAIEAATDGVLVEVRVQPGDKVRSGDVLCVLSSPEIGSARADVLRREADLALVQRRLDRQRTVADNVTALLTALQTLPTLADVEREFRERRLGEFRERLLTAYAKLRLAETLAGSARSDFAAGALSSRSVQERLSERETTEAAFRAACEQIDVDTRLEVEKSEAEVADATRRVQIARQHLSTLLGYEEPKSGSGTAEAKALSSVETRAPFDGTIEERRRSAFERVARGDELFVLADPRRLWVSAAVREQDWPALGLAPGAELLVETPAIPGRQWTARMVHTGREVSATSNAVPLVAGLEDPEGALRPGLFVRVTIPVGEPRLAVAVPSEAIVEHEGKSFVFVEESPGTFRRRDVVPGETDGGWIEIREGLAADSDVVVRGAFVLKSELLLDREEE